MNLGVGELTKPLAQCVHALERMATALETIARAAKDWESKQ